jgi:VWFA-related protein
MVRVQLEGIDTATFHQLALRCERRTRPRWRSRLGLLAISVILSLPTRPLLSQQPPTISTEVKVVNVLATVRDKHGEIVRGLTKDDFLLAEDGRPQTIGYFSPESDLPLILGLLVDTSLSQRRVLGQERSASSVFFDQVLRVDRDRGFVIHFDREVELLQDITSSRQKLQSALELLKTPQRAQEEGDDSPGSSPSARRSARAGTLLYDAVYLASNEMMMKEQGRKALIILSDGVDRGSKETLASAIEAAQRADTLVYSILFKDEEGYGSRGGFGGPGMGRMGRRGGGMRRYPQESRPDGKKILEQVSRKTGGRLFEVSKKQPIEKIYDLIQEELRNQYNLGYTPDRPNPGPGYHKITLTSKEKRLMVQARDGYYTQQ